MFNRGWRMAALAAALAGMMAAPAASADDQAGAEAVLAKLRGEWVGVDKPEERWVFEGDTLMISGTERRYMARVKLDPKAKPHPAVEFRVLEGPEDAMGKTNLGIYKLEGGRLTVCVGVEADARPAKFEQVEGESYLFELKRP